MSFVRLQKKQFNNDENLAEKISVIIPVYNSESTLAFCFDSLLASTYKNLEIIFVDDGSKDNSLSILESFASKDDRVKVVKKANGGVSSARNLGILNATGEYLFFLDSDDCVKRDSLQKALYYVNAYKYANLSFNFEKVVELKEYNKCAPNYNVKGRFGSKSVNGAVEFNTFADFYEHFNVVPLYNRLFERKVIIDNGIFFDESLSYGEDGLFVLNYLLKSNKEKSVFVDETVYCHYLRGNDSLEYKYTEKMFDDFEKFFLRQKEILESHSVFESCKPYYYSYYLYNLFHILSTRQNLDEKYLEKNNVFLKEERCFIALKKAKKISRKVRKAGLSGDFNKVIFALYCPSLKIRIKRKFSMIKSKIKGEKK